MSVVSCPGCGRRLDAAIAVCPDCQAVLRPDKVQSASKLAQQQRAQEAEARFRANAQSVADEDAAEAAAKEEAKKAASAAKVSAAAETSARYAQEARSRVARKLNPEYVIISGVDMSLTDMFWLVVKFTIAACPALMVAGVVLYILFAGLISWLRVLH